MDDKTEEKELQKREEKGYQDTLNSLIGAALLIWAGVVLLAANVGFLGIFTSILEQLPIRTYDLPFDIPFFSPSAWQVFFLGAGLIVTVEIVLRLLVPHFRKRLLGTLIAAVALFSLGLGQWNLVGPLIVITLGVYILFRALTGRRRW